MIGFLDKDMPVPPEAVAGGLFDKIMAQIETDPVLNIALANGEIRICGASSGRHALPVASAPISSSPGEAAQLWSRGQGRRKLSGDDLLALLTVMLALASQRQTWRPTSTARRSPCCAASSSPA